MKRTLASVADLYQRCKSAPALWLALLELQASQGKCVVCTKASLLGEIAGIKDRKTITKCIDALEWAGWIRREYGTARGSHGPCTLMRLRLHREAQKTVHTKSKNPHREAQNSGRTKAVTVKPKKRAARRHLRRSSSCGPKNGPPLPTGERGRPSAAAPLPSKFGGTAADANGARVPDVSAAADAELKVLRSRGSIRSAIEGCGDPGQDHAFDARANGCAAEVDQADDAYLADADRKTGGSS